MPGPGLEEVTPGGGDTRSSALSPVQSSQAGRYGLWVLCRTVHFFTIICIGSPHSIVTSTHLYNLIANVSGKPSPDGKGRATLLPRDKRPVVSTKVVV